jgi:hypothetical protein
MDRHVERVPIARSHRRYRTNGQWGREASRQLDTRRRERPDGPSTSYSLQEARALELLEVRRARAGDQGPVVAYAADDEQALNEE